MLCVVGMCVVVLVLVAYGGCGWCCVGDVMLRVWWVTVVVVMGVRWLIGVGCVVGFPCPRKSYPFSNIRIYNSPHENLLYCRLQ